MKSTILMLIIVGLLITLVPSAYAQTTVTFQEQGVNLIDDSYLAEESPTTNYGSSSNIAVGETSSGGASTLASLVKWNITDLTDITSDEIDSAIIGLYLYGTFYESSEGNITAYCSDQLNWQEETATWNNRPTTGLTLSGSNSSNLDSPSDIWVLFNVTDCFKDYVGGDNVTFFFNDTSGLGTGSNDYGNFRAGEYGTPSLRPFLEVTYTEAVDTSILYLENETTGEAWYDLGSAFHVQPLAGSNADDDQWFNATSGSYAGGDGLQATDTSGSETDTVYGYLWRSGFTEGYYSISTFTQLKQGETHYYNNNISIGVDTNCDGNLDYYEIGGLGTFYYNNNTIDLIQHKIGSETEDNDGVGVPVCVNSSGILSFHLFGNGTAPNVGNDIVLSAVNITNYRDTAPASDTTPPASIDWISPTPAQNSWQDSNSAVGNVSFVEDNPYNCWVDVDGTNQTGTLSGAFCWYSASGLSDSSHTFQAWINDTSANLNNSDVRTFNVDTTDPASITYVSPTPDSGLWINYDYVYVNATFTETNVASCDVEFGGANQTGTINGDYCYYNNTGVADNMYSYKVWITDNAGNVGVSATRSINVDTTVPYGLIFITPSPADSSWFTSTTFTVNMTFIEDNPDTCLIEIDSGNNTGTIDGEFCYFEETGASQGSHSYLAYLNDSASNMNQTETITFDIDSISPVVSDWVSPTLPDVAGTPNDYVEMNFTFTETNTDSCWFILASTYYEGAITGDYCWYNATGIADSIPTYRGYVNDTAGQEDSTSLRTIIVDTTPPVATTYSAPTPANDSWLDSGSFLMNFTYVEANELYCGIVLDTIEYSNGTIDSKTCTYSVTGLGEGDHTFYGWINDSAGHRVNLATRTVHIDTTSPSSIAYVDPTPTNASTINESFIEINVTFSETNVASCYVQVANATTVNYTGVITDDSCYYNAGGQSEDDVTITVFVTDSAGNVGQSADRVVTIDLPEPPPAITGVITGATGSILNGILILGAIALLMLISRGIIFNRSGEPLSTDKIITLFVIIAIGIILIGVMASLI